MFETFLNPWAMAAGTVLISSPIIIHLINRMRYRRVRWAAMEFLLKSQKKNRRRVIIEQIILLLLRILLVLLTGFLLGRFIGAVTGSQQSTRHVILLKDRPSMGDFHREDGKELTAFTQAKRVVNDIAQFASEATTPQSLTLIRMSDPENPRHVERLNSDTIGELNRYLADLEVSTVHVDTIKGLKAAETVMNESKEERRLLHIVDDFRSTDWTGAPSDGLRQALDQFRAMKVDVHLVDAAYPVRGDTQKTALYHDNMAIVDFQPETRVVAQHMPVEFIVGVANNSSSERKNVRVTVRVKGQDRAEGSFTLPSAPAGSVTTGTFLISFPELGQNPVSVNLESEEAGLSIDNVRHTVVEVRERVPMLLIEGDLKTKGTAEGDGYYLQQLFSEATRGFNVMMRTPAELEKLNLDQFPSIFLLNVGRLTDGAVKALDKYVRNGGGLAFFMGNEVKPDFYNKLYADGKGLFPVPLADKPTEPPADDVKLARLLGNLAPKAYPRNMAHPVFTRIYRDEKTHGPSRENNKHLYFAAIDRYWPVPRQRWDPKPGETEELMTLPNNRQIVDYADLANSLLKSMASAATDARNAKYKARLDEYQRNIQNVLLVGGELYKLVNPVDALLNDTGEANNPAKPNLQEFWQAREQTELRDQFAKLLETVRYGDPYLVTKSVGKGRVLTCLSTANAAWNDMPSGPSRIYWVMLMVEMQKYMASNTADINLLLGQPLTLELDSTRYDTNVQRYFPPKIDYMKGGQIKYAPVDAGKQVGVTSANKLTFNFAEARQPGVYEFVLSRKDAPDPDAKPAPGAPKVPAEAKGGTETLAYAFNVDAVAESDLKRASTDDIAAVTGDKVPLHRPGDGGFEKLLKDKKSDMSESPWLYLLFLLVLIAEQAMAVRLSFHSRGQEMAPTYSSPASTPAAVPAAEPAEPLAV